MAWYGKTMVGTAATTTLVAAGQDSAVVTLEKAAGRRVSVKFVFTKGDETSATIKFWVSLDGTNYYAVTDDQVGTYETLTATGTKVYRFSSLPGWRFFKVSVLATGGTPTGTYGVDYYYDQPGSVN